MTDEVMFEIRELTGQQYTNVYAGKTPTPRIPLPSKVAHVADEVPAERELVGVGG